MNSKTIIFIVGPTAVGKSDVAYLLAKKIDAEIISCDSMQVYKNIHIASNKPSPVVLKKIPHHCLDLIDISKEFNVADFYKRANRAVRGIHRKGKSVIVCGGSGLYMAILLDGIFSAGAFSKRVRQKLLKQVKEKSGRSLFDQLKKRDPQAAQNIHPNDAKKIVRALEVCLVADQPFSRIKKKREGLWGKYSVRIFCLSKNRPELYQCINQRVDHMFKKQLVKEIKNLHEEKWSQTAQALIGVKEIRDYLNGKCCLDEAKRLIQRNTRRLAKRQLTWFRKDKRLEWIDVDSLTPARVAEEITRRLEKEQ